VGVIDHLLRVFAVHHSPITNMIFPVPIPQYRIDMAVAHNGARDKNHLVALSCHTVGELHILLSGHEEDRIKTAIIRKDTTCRSLAVVVQDPINCFLKICCDAISIVSVRLEASESLPPQARQDEDGAAAQGQASRDITEGIADQVRSRQVQIETLRSLE
jgi:hypothetical protein